MVLVGAIGGFRSGVLMDLKYRDVYLELIYCPGISQKNLVAIFIIH